MTTTKNVRMSLTETVAAARVMREVYRSSRCACGCGGTWDRTVSGTIGGLPAVWMGCRYNNGSAVGGGLTGEDYHVALAVCQAARHHGYTPQEVVETEVVRDCGRDLLCGPAEREADTAHWESVARAKAAREAREAARQAEYERTRPEREAAEAAARAAVEAERAARRAEIKPLFDRVYATARTKQQREVAIYLRDEAVTGYESDRAHARRQLEKMAAGGEVSAESCV